VGQSPEAAARMARYQAFAKLLQPGDYLLTAHHQDDQAETFLLQLLRGAGLKGLASMPIGKSFAQGYHLRPLLSYSRSELLIYAKEHKLVWIEDESNFNTHFDRNFIRHQVMPLLQQRWPAAASTVARAAKHLAEASELQEWLANSELTKITGSQPQTMAIDKLAAYPVAIQKWLLRGWLAQKQFPMPSEMQLQRMLHDVLDSREDADPQVIWQSHQLRRYRNDLYALPLAKTCSHNFIIPWDIKSELVLPNQRGTLTLQTTQGQGLSKPVLQQAQVTIRFRQGGERCQPKGRIGSHPLKKLLQEWGVPPWQRDQIPLLYVEEQLAAVVGFCVCEPFAVTEPEAEGCMVYLMATN
jgi:tRNA(Ile)-lysidine synthase